MPPNSYDKSILFDVGRWSDDPRINRLARQITAGIVHNFKRGYKSYQKRYDTTIKNVLLNLLVCFDHPSAEWVAYSRNKNDYGINTRYDKLHINYGPLIKVVDTMIARGYIDNKNGINYIGFGRMSRMRPTAKLLRLLSQCTSVRVKCAKELIQLKDADKKLIDYQDTPFSRRKRRIIKRLNSVISGGSIDIQLSNQQELEYYRKNNKWIDCSLNTMHRVFNNSSFEEGGRFVGGWWQWINAELRSLIRINGEPVVELDYSCFHTRMLYDIECVPQPLGDMYLVDGFERAREICKKMINVIYNAKSVEKAEQAVRIGHNLKHKRPNTYTKQKMMDLIHGLRDKHSSIAHYFGSGIGRRLQFLDSCISERIMVTLANHGVTCLPVHDSFVVPESCERLLWDAMRREYMNEFGKEPVIDKK